MPRSDFNEAELALIAQADELERQSKAKREEAFAARDNRDRERPAADRLVFAARSRCICGHGLAYDPAGDLGGDANSPHHRPNQWECSAVLLGIADDKLRHSDPLPFAFYEVKSETQPSANGQTTRTPAPPHPDNLPKVE